MENLMETQQQEENSIRGRRSALLMGGAALAGLALSRSARAQAAATVTDADILNFALNLEFLEAQYYTLATTGMKFDAAGGTITSGSGAAGGTVAVKSNPKVAFTDANLQAYAMETAEDEQHHVKFLQSALNASGANAAVAMPNIDLMTSFNTLAMAAGLGATFDPFANETNFLIGAFIFEDVGVSAYLGAAPLIQSSAYLTAALGIHAVEAYHAGNIRTQIFAAGSTAMGISQAIANTRAKLDGSNPADDIGVSIITNSLGMASTIVDAMPTVGRVAPRTTSQVLSIVYGGGAPGVGGVFFPNGMNGTIK